MARAMTVPSPEKSHFSQDGANLRTSHKLVPSTMNQKSGCKMPAMK
jgi:hypothetical protein